MKLDIGCGNNIRGDIGIDIAGTPTILASAEYLPFRSNIFDLAVSWECVAHLDGPPNTNLSISEGLRVAKELHLYTWDEPMILDEITTPYTKLPEAYIPIWYLPEEPVELEFFVKLTLFSSHTTTCMESEPN